MSESPAVARLKNVGADAQDMIAPTDMTFDEARDFMARHQVRYILAQFVDIHGVAKTKSVPVSHLQDVLETGAGFAGFAVWGLGMEPHDPDFMAKGDLSTLMLTPWQPGYARMVGSGYVKDEPYPYDTRNILKQQIARLDERGWSINTGLEPEFMLLARNEDGTVCPHDPTDTLDKPCYDYKGLARNRAFLERLADSLMAVGIDVTQIDHEDANGQFEVNYMYSDGLTTADRLIYIKMAAAEIAQDLGMVCSFMPKPSSMQTGNGMHVHLSVVDRAGKNLFGDDSDVHGLGLSQLGYHFCGGLLKHAPALTALMAPTVNSYKRLVVGRTLSGASWAPAYISYGDNNRTSMVRIPYGRLEMRLGDSAMNPYLATAAIIAAGLDGVDTKVDPGKPQNMNFYACTPEELKEMGVGLLPQSLSEAINALEEDTVLHDALGDEFIREFVDLKRREWVEYHRHVSDWEVRRYLEFF